MNWSDVLPSWAEDRIQPGLCAEHKVNKVLVKHWTVRFGQVRHDEDMRTKEHACHNYTDSGATQGDQDFFRDGGAPCVGKVARTYHCEGKVLSKEGEKD